MNKNEIKLKSFVAFCKQHPDLRFWQALVAWSDYNVIYGSKGDNLKTGDLHDTYYID